MKIEVKYSRDDVKRVQDVVASMADHYMVVERRKRNVSRLGIDISHGSVWKKQIGCLLTTQQKSSEDSAVQRFIRSNSPPVFSRLRHLARPIITVALWIASNHFAKTRMFFRVYSTLRSLRVMKK